jgi:hypothetical protein
MRLSLASDPAEINSPLPGVKFEAPDAAPIEAQVQLLLRMSQSVTSLEFSASPSPHVSQELDPAGAGPNPVAGKISPARQAGLLAAAALQIFPPSRSSALLRQLAKRSR